MNAQTEAVARRLEFVWLEITEKCNLLCSHCYADSGPHQSMEGAMTKALWLRIIDEAADLGVNGLQFIGGEPTIHPHFKELLARAASKGIRDIEVYTNATRMSNEVVSELKNCGARLATSFYSSDPTVHDLVTLTQGSWKRTVSGIEKALDAGIPLRVGVIETDRNVGHSRGAGEFLRGLGVSVVGFDRERGVGRGNKLRLSPNEDFSQLCGQCWKSRVCITASTKIYPCVFSRRTVIGDARDGLRAALNSVTLSTFTEKLQEEMSKRAESENCYPDLPCSPQVCSPELNCQPMRACTPDAQCTPHYEVSASATCYPDLPCAPQVCQPELNCQPIRHCSPDAQCIPHVGISTKASIDLEAPAS